MVNKTILFQEAQPQTKKQKDYILIVDFSGSMHYQLPHIRDYVLATIKEKVEFGSTFSIAYFSSTGDHETFLSHFQVDEKMDKKYLEKKLKDKFQSRGATTFTGGLKELISILGGKKDDDRSVLVEFITDGYDNGSRVEDILSMVSEASKFADSFTVLEYGNYCNHDLLVKMSDAASENCSSRVVYSKDHNAFSESLDNYIKQEFLSDKISIEAPQGAMYACVGLSQFKVNEGKASVPKSSTVYFIGNTQEVSLDGLNEDDLYVLAYHTAFRMYPSIAFKVLSKLGDKALFRAYSNAIGQQRLNECLAYMGKCVEDKSMRFLEGRDYNLVSKDDAFSVLDCMELLQGDKKAKFYPYKTYGWDYSPITQPQEQATAVLSKEEKELIKEYADKGDINSIKELTGSKFKLKFDRTSLSGIPFSDFVFNEGEGRANMSVRAYFKGNVDLSLLNRPHLPSMIDTAQYKTYSLVSDGIVNVDFIPTSMSKATFDVLLREGVVEGEFESEDTIHKVNISKLPVVNRESTKNLSFVDMVNDAWEMTKAKAEIKVVRDYISSYGEKVNKGLVELYGEDIAKELKELGFGSEFNPKTVKIGEWHEEPYSYLKVEFITGAKGGAFTLPSVNAVNKKLDEKKALNVAETMMSKAIKECEDIKAFSPEKAKEFLEAKLEMLNYGKRKREYSVAKKQFSILLTNGWFSDIDSSVREYSFEDPEYGTIKVKIEYGMK